MPGISTLQPIQPLSHIATGGTCQKVAISTTSAQSAAITGNVVHVTPTVDCYVRAGLDPTALSTGVDHFMLANATQSFTITALHKLAFITESGTGTVRIAQMGV